MVIVLVTKENNMEKRNIRKYDNIINLPHHVSEKHPQLSKEARAAQFSPFAALTGFEDEIKETSRLTDNYRDMAEDFKDILDVKLSSISARINEYLTIKVLYYKADRYKEGGSYLEYIGKPKKIDRHKKCIVFEDKSEIEIDQIFDIEII